MIDNHFQIRKIIYFKINNLEHFSKQKLDLHFNVNFIHINIMHPQVRFT